MVLIAIILFPNLKYLVWSTEGSATIMQNMLFLPCVYTTFIYLVMAYELGRQSWVIIIDKCSGKDLPQTYQLVKVLLHLILLNIMVIRIYRIDDHIEQIVKPVNTILYLLTLFFYSILIDYAIIPYQNQYLFESSGQNSDSQLKRKFSVLLEIIEGFSTYIVPIYYLIWGSFSHFDSNDDTKDDQRFLPEILLMILSIGTMMCIKDFKSRMV